ncbi:MAG: cbb3-type cytochrome c oxidase subunit I [Acidimicrobiales bacterium]
MTVTDAKPEDVTALTGDRSNLPATPPSPPRGLLGMLATADHKTVGRLYLGVSLVTLGAALVLSTLIASEGIDAAGAGPFDSRSYFQAETLSHVGLFFLGLIPALLGLAMFVVPLQVGSPTIAFPRAAAASFWGWLLGGGLLIGSYLADGGPLGGNHEAELLFLLSWAMVIASLGLGCICVIATVTTARANGMTLLRVPAFSWAMLVAATLWLFNMAALLGNLIIVYIDADHAGVLYGAGPNRWMQLSWIFAQPAVLSFAIPLLGVVAEAVPVAARQRIARHPVVLVTIAAFGALTFGAYAQTAFNPGLVHEAMFVVGSVILVLPLLALLGGLADTLRRGRPRPGAALVVGLVGLITLLEAALVAGLYAIEPLDLAYTLWGHGVEKLVVAAALCGVGAGLFHWGPKIWGFQLPQPLGALLAPVLLGGGALYAVGDLIAGANGQQPLPARGITDVVADGAELGAGLSTAGGALLVLAVVIMALAVLPAALRRTPKADADPWGGHTLEWTTASPPPFGNFIGPVAPVTSPTPLLDARESASLNQAGTVKENA